MDDAANEQLRSDRFTTFLTAGARAGRVGPIEIDPASFGTPDEWAHSALSYLSCMLNGTQGGTLGTVLAYVERLEINAGIIPAPGGAA
jgi:hypothetical protein